MKAPTVPLALLLVVAAASAAAATGETAASTVPDLSGRWILNETLSETLREKVRDATIEQTDDPRTRARWNRMGERGRQRQSASEFSQLTIRQRDPMLEIAYRDGRRRTLSTNGRDLGPEEGTTIVNSRATWEGRRLIVEVETRQSGYTEFWEISDDEHRLFVTTDVDRGEPLGVVSFRRIYDREPPSTEAAQSAETGDDGR